MELTGEVSGADFGDRRLTERLVTVINQMVTEPDASFPAAAGGEAALEATYRFLNNRSVTPDRILAPHARATVERCEAAAVALVVHDTTEMNYGDHADVGWLDRKRRGFLAHFALALTADDVHRPLGVLGLRAIFRPQQPKDRSTRRQRRFAVDNEDRRWGDLVEDVEATLAGRAAAIHVMDREADSYRLLSALHAKDRRYVIRMTFDRRVRDERGQQVKVGDVLQHAPSVLMREVPLAPRKRASNPKVRHAHPARAGRLATLCVSAHALQLVRPDWAGRDCPAELTVNVVRVWEPEPPLGEKAIEWRLATTEPIETPADAARVVDLYRARWVIEEYFKALKTGCALERRQLENRRALLNALALFSPIAWQLLLLRALSRATPQAAASTALSLFHLRLLQRHPNVKLRAGASVGEAMLAVARLGGHIKNNGEPGWIVLGRGYEKLLALEEGALLLLTSDQS